MLIVEMALAIWVGTEVYRWLEWLELRSHRRGVFWVGEEIHSKLIIRFGGCSRRIDPGFVLSPLQYVRNADFFRADFFHAVEK